MTLKKQVTAELKTRTMVNNQSPALDMQLAIALDVIEKRFERQQAEFNGALQNIMASKATLTDFDMDDYLRTLRDYKGFV